MESKENTHPPDAEGDEDLNGDGAAGEAESMIAKLDNQLALLAAVRRPGKGRLNLAEAMTAAFEQAHAYDQWRQFGAPAGVIEVWVESQRVMSVQPGNTTDLRGVLFEMATVPRAVVQVVRRADEVSDTVVLLNRELTEVLRKGGGCTERLPNHQEVRLEVKREGHGQLSFWVGFNPVGAMPAGEPGVLERLKGRAAAACACVRQQFQRVGGSKRVPTFGMATAVAALVLTAGLLLLTLPQAGARAESVAEESACPHAISAAHVTPVGGIYDNLTSLDFSEAEMVSIRKALLPLFAVRCNEAFMEAGLRSPNSVLWDTRGGGWISGDSTLYPDGGIHLLSAATWSNYGKVFSSERAQAGRVNCMLGDVQLNLNGVARIFLDDTAFVHNVNDTALVNKFVLPRLERERGSGEFSRDAQRLSRLKGVQSVLLEIEDSESLDEAQMEGLLKSLSNAFEAAGITVLTEETNGKRADCVVSVNFEPDTTRLGAIFATVHDRDDNFLWRAYAGCRTLPGGSRNMFDDASRRLVAKLPLRTGTARQNAGATDLSVAALKRLRALNAYTHATQLSSAMPQESAWALRHAYYDAKK